MRQIDLRSTLITIFRVDEIDFLSLLTGSFASEIRSRYGCEVTNAQLAPGNRGLEFSPGRVTLGGNVKVIDRILVEERRLIVTVGGSSDDARVLEGQLENLILACETRCAKSSLVRVVQFEEAQCIVQLQIAFGELLNRSTFGSLSQSLQASAFFQKSLSPVRVLPIGCRFLIRYEGKDPSLVDNAITVGDKYLTIEAREGINPEERVFVASGPLKSDDLLKLLQSLEEQAQNLEEQKE